MKDNRVALASPDLQEELEWKLLWLRSLPEFVWATIAALSGISSSELRGQCVRAGHRACAFFAWRVLRPSNQLPWTLCRGDIKSNLEKLKAGPRPINSTAEKPWVLLQNGVIPMVVLIRLVTLLADTPWTTMVVEQLHGSLAALSRVHPEYELSTFFSRTFIMYMMRLLWMLTKEDKSIEKTRKALGRIDRKVPRRCGPKQVYLSDLHSKLALPQYQQPLAKKKRLVKTLIKTHSSKFSAKPRSFINTYKMIAITRAAKRHMENCTERQALIKTLQKQLTDRRSVVQRPPLTIESASFHQTTIEKMETKWNRVTSARIAWWPCVLLRMRPLLE